MAKIIFTLSAAAAALVSCSLVAFAANTGEATKATNGERATRVQTSCGKLGKSEDAQSSVGVSTSSTTFVDVAGSQVSFNIGGTGNTSVIFYFSGQVFAPSSAAGTGLMFVQAVRDTSIVSVDGPVQFQSESGTFSNAHAYNFLFTNVPPGAHTVKMQFRSNNSGNTVFIYRFNGVVYHH
jgi:hypothetical protein